ncbi:MAG TPA: hypothetical protein EYQ50_28350 [Verrucomicrobiales bacterium]|nr:hypothetical protein [Verrucomicrobiales bacterium]
MVKTCWSISRNTFMELVRQPVFLILSAGAPSFIILLGSVYYFGMGDDPKMVKQSGLAVLLLAGLFCAVFGASASVAGELKLGTALIVLAKPISRLSFLISKFLGICAIINMLFLNCLLTALLADFMAFDAHGEPHWIGLSVYFGLILCAFFIAALTNYFLKRSFIQDASFGILLGTLAAFILIGFVIDSSVGTSQVREIDWRMVPVGFLILFALWVLAAVALTCSTRLEMVPTLVICSGILLLGLVSDYFFGRSAEAGRVSGSILYSLVPNWQIFWMIDTLETRRTIPWSYFLVSAFYMLSCLTGILALANHLFRERDLS